MSPNALPFLMGWAALACVVLALAVYKAILYVRAGKQESAAPLRHAEGPGCSN
jgi:hypothetical protein